MKRFGWHKLIALTLAGIVSVMPMLALAAQQFGKGNISGGDWGGVPAYQLDIRSGTNQTQIHLRSNSTVDDGGFIMSEAPAELFLSGGAAWNGAAWVAKTNLASIWNSAFDGSLRWFSDTGLTIGNTFTPTQRMQLGPGAGGLGIGRAAAGSFALDVNGTVGNSGAALFIQATPAATGTAHTFNTNGVVMSGAGLLFAYQNNGTNQITGTFDGYIRSTTPFTLSSFFVNAAIPAGAQTYGGGVLPARAFTVNAVKGRVSVAAVGAGTHTWQVTDGANLCNCAQACAGETANTNLRTTCAGAGGTGCVYAASASLSYTTLSSTCATSQATYLGNVDIEGDWQ